MGPPQTTKTSMQELYAGPADWEAHRETITQLYLHEKMPLQDVMEYMAVNHCFFATVKMYRTRIRKWGIDKNNKAAEVSYMLKLKKHRDALGKGSCFFVRGRPVDWDDIERYLSRNPAFWAKHSSGSLDLSTAAQNIRCRTPPPPATTQKLSVPQKLDGPEHLRGHEDILRLFRAYTEGCFEQRIWNLSPAHKRYFGPGGVEANVRLNSWYESVRNASDWPGKDADAVRLVNHLLDDLPQLLRDQDYTVFPALMRCCFYLSVRRPPLGRAVLDFVARLCGIVLGEQHPMTLAWFRIRSLSPDEYLRVLQGTARVRLDHLQKKARPNDSDGDGDVGVLDENTINALREYFMVLRLGGSEAADEMERVTAWATAQIGASDHALTGAHCRLLLGTASCYITCRRFDDAEKVLERIGAHLSTSSPAHSLPAQRNLSTYLFLMGFLRYATGRPDEAVNYFLQTYYVLEKAAGPDSSAVADILLALIDFPGLLRNPEDAKHWQAKFDQVQARILARAERGGRRAVVAELDEMWDGPLDTDVNTSVW
ncbi:hypothetical protein VTK26DRAFT_7944 [Humicola hyalothermophila]